MRSTQMRTDQLRDAIAKTVRMLAKDSVRVTQIGAGAYCRFDKKGKVTLINLPVIPDNPSDDFLTALQGFLDHEVAHMYQTDASTYGGKHTIVDGKGGTRNIDLSGMTNIVEDVRIEAGFAKMFAGSEANLEALRGFMISKYWVVWLGQVQAASLDADEKDRRIRTLALVPFMRARGGQKRCGQFLTDNNLWPYFEELDVRIPDLAERFAALKSTQDATNLAKVIVDALYPPQPPEQEPEADDEPGDQALGNAKGGEAGESDQDDADEEGAGDEGQVGGADESPDGKPDKKGEPMGDLDDVDFGADGEMDDAPPEEPESGDGEPEPEEGQDEEQGGAGGASQNVKLRDAMKRLSPDQRRALFLYNKRKESIPDIAHKLGKSVSSVHQILGKARKRLAGEMSKRG